MSMGTGIEWAEASWNPVTGCTRKSAGCDNCYAVTMTHRLEAMGQEKYRGLTVVNGRGDRHFNGQVHCHADDLAIPMRWKKPRRIFVNSMSDLFHAEVPDDFIDKVFAVMALCRQHQFLILTKRPERMAGYFHKGLRRNIAVYDAAADLVDADFSRFPGDMAQTRSSGGSWWPLPNVWLGVSCEDQAAADERIPHLLRTPAAVRFLSCEPLLGPIDLPESLQARTRTHLRMDVSGAIRNRAFSGFSERGVPLSRAEAERQLRDLQEAGVKYIAVGDCDNFTADDGCGGHRVPGIDWVIVGGESGKGARPCNVEWVASIVQQCQAAGVACFVKQLGSDPRWKRTWNGQEISPEVDDQLAATLRWAGKTEAEVRDVLSSVDALPRMRLVDKKGGDPDEWPAELRVREFPKIGGGA